MKILLTTLNSKFIHTNLAIRYLKSYTKDLVDADIREYTINNDLDYILKDIYKNDYDVILFSTYIWNVLDIVKLCENIKKVKPNTIIGLGGPEVTYDSENAMEKYPFVDYILCGEGELVFRDLVMYLQGNKNIEDVEGIVYRNNGEIVVNRPKELLQNLDEIPSPYENLDPKEYENRIVYYETSRGCPFNCQYCLSSTLKGLRYFSIDRVKKDLKALIDARVSQIKFIDRTFNANKKFAKEIMNFLMVFPAKHVTASGGSHSNPDSERIKRTCIRIIPVSYTHLDVYKRQSPDSNRIGADISRYSCECRT